MTTTARHLPASSDPGVLVLVGTTKGAFLLRSDRKRKRWDVGGPYFPGHSIYALAYDGRAGRRRIWAAASSMHFGATLHSSDDFGRKWTDPETASVRFPQSTDKALAQVWQLTPGRDSEPDTLYCGVEPAALFVSRDAGDTWELERGLWDHPHRPQWQPGGGGLGLHTISLHPTDPHKLLVAISTGGVYASDDAGTSWRASTRGVRADFLPDKQPEFGQCVHKIARSPADPERLYLQNHWGLYRSDDGGASWTDIANGVPSDFGFPVAAHPRDRDTAWIVPLESDGFRVTPGGKLRVYRTTNGGKMWKPMSKGLPQDGAYETVLRDGLAVDALDPVGVYFGTRRGEVWASSDEGESWKLALGGLPPVVCVKAVGLGGKLAAKPKKAAKKAARADKKAAKSDKKAAKSDKKAKKKNKK